MGGCINTVTHTYKILYILGSIYPRHIVAPDVLFFVCANYRNALDIFIHQGFPLLLSFFLSYLIPLQHANSFLPCLYLSCSSVSLSFLCIFFHFFIEVITSVSLFTPASNFLELCVLLLLWLSSTHDLWWITVSL